MTNKIIYFPMCFSGTDWQTQQALAEKKLICGWATAELYPLIKKTHQEIKNKADLNSLKTKFAEEFIKIVTNQKSKYYKTHYHPWFFNEKSTKIISGAIGNIFRFLLIETSDLLYIKTSDRDAIHIAQVGCDSKISFGKTYCDKEYEDCEYTAFFLDNVEFSEPIKKNNLFEKCDDLLNQKYPNEKDILLDKLKKNINNLRGTCLYAINKDKDLRLKEVFYDVLNFYTNQVIEFKTDLRCEKMMDIIINHICKKKAVNANMIPICYKKLAEEMNNNRLVFDNDLTFNQRTLAKNSKVEMDGDTTLGFLLEKIYYKCEILKIPHLNYLVVLQANRKCGDGVKSFGLNEKCERENIWKYDWDSWRNTKNIIKTVDEIEKNSEKKEYITEQFSRDSKVREQVIKEANGVCQGCKKQSFEKENGEIYLEVHHKIYLSQNGADTVENCVALCPNCHKNEHFGKEKNRKFYQKQ